MKDVVHSAKDNRGGTCCDVEGFLARRHVEGFLTRRHVERHLADEEGAVVAEAGRARLEASNCQDHA